MQKKRAHATPKEREESIAKNAASMQKTRAHATSEEREKRTANNAASMQKKCAHATPEERGKTKAKNTANRQKKHAPATSGERETSRLRCRGHGGGAVHLATGRAIHRSSAGAFSCGTSRLKKQNNLGRGAPSTQKSTAPPPPPRDQRLQHRGRTAGEGTNEGLQHRGEGMSLIEKQTKNNFGWPCFLV